VGYFRVQYDAATLALNTHAFGNLPDADRIALLDDQWALVDAGKAPLASYLALASKMGGSLDARAWVQIAGALGTIEHDERGSKGHEAFTAYARSILKPAAQQLGWDAKPGETPAVQGLRRTLIGELGAWGDPATLAEARRRFALFLKDPKAIGADDQQVILAIVGKYADAGTFEQLHTRAKQARDDAERLRFYIALATTRDPKLADQVAQIGLGSELPPQDLQTRLGMLATLRDEHPQLTWNIFSQHADALLSPMGALAPMALSENVPQLCWDALPADQLEAWLKSHLPAEMAPNIAKGMEGVHFKVAEKATLVPAADAFIAAKDKD